MGKHTSQMLTILLAVTLVATAFIAVEVIVAQFIWNHFIVAKFGYAEIGKVTAFLIVTMFNGLCILIRDTFNKS